MARHCEAVKDGQTVILFICCIRGVWKGICIGQLSVGEKSNEILAFPELISLLELKGMVVTADALNTQKKSAKAVIERGADYIFPAKENHPGLLEDIKLLFSKANSKKFQGIDASHFETTEKKGGRVGNTVHMFC